MNRERYSHPDDVLWPSWRDQGVAEITVAQVRACSFESGDQRVFDLHPVHDPLPLDPPLVVAENYAHSLICTHTPPGGRHVQPTAAVKKRARNELSSLLQIARPPMDHD